MTTPARSILDEMNPQDRDKLARTLLKGLMGTLEDDDASARMIAVKNLGRMGTFALPAANGLGNRLMRDPDDNIRVEAARSLALIGREATPWLVAALAGGQLAAQFMGAKPEGQVRQFFDQVLKAFAQAMPEAAQALEAAAKDTPAPASPAQTKRDEAARLAGDGDLKGAIAALNAALVLDPGMMDAKLDLAELEIAGENVDAAKARLDAIELPPGQREQATRRDSLVARIAALDAVKDLPATAELEAAHRANPGDHKVRFDLAHALIAEGAFDQALEHLLEIVRADRNWNEQGPRKAMLNVFNLLAGNEESGDLVSAYRRKLATALN